MDVRSDRALSSTETEAIISELRDRAEAIDALYRFSLGLDLRDRQLAASAFAPDAELESPAPTGDGAQGSVMKGREAIVDAVFDKLAQLDTTHVVTNPRIQVTGDTAHLTAIVEAQHLLTADHSRNTLLKSRYTSTLTRDGRRWVIRRLRVQTIWYAGNPVAVFG